VRWWIAVLVSVWASGCGVDGVADMAMDRQFRGGEATPVHPPRGQRGEARPAGAISMQSDSIDCMGTGLISHANIEMRISAPAGARVRGDCQLRLTNVDLIADDGVVLDGGGLVMVGGSIKAKGVGVRASGNATVELTDVTINGTTGIEASDQARVTTKGGRLIGTSVSVAARDHAKLVLEGTALEGPTAKDPTAALTVVEEQEP
jgi:hypothetical protein